MIFLGLVKVVLRWSFPGHDGDAIADGYRIFVNGKQYGGDLSVHTTNAMIEVNIMIYGLNLLRGVNLIIIS